MCIKQAGSEMSLRLLHQFEALQFDGWFDIDAYQPGARAGVGSGVISGIESGVESEIEPES